MVSAIYSWFVFNKLCSHTNTRWDVKHQPYMDIFIWQPNLAPGQAVLGRILGKCGINVYMYLYHPYHICIIYMFHVYRLHVLDFFLLLLYYKTMPNVYSLYIWSLYRAWDPLPPSPPLYPHSLWRIYGRHHRWSVLLDTSLHWMETEIKSSKIYLLVHLSVPLYLSVISLVTAEENFQLVFE